MYDVFVIIKSNRWDEKTIVYGVYDSREKAKEAVSKYVECSPREENYFHIETHTVND